MIQIYKLRFLILILGFVSLILGLFFLITGRSTLGLSCIKYGGALTVFGIIVLQAIKQLKQESLVDAFQQAGQEESHLIREIDLSEFDDEETPVLRVFSNGTSALIFEVFPPENGKLTENQLENFRDVLCTVTGVDVLHDDRERFLIFSNSDDVIDKIVEFFRSCRLQSDISSDFLPKPSTEEVPQKAKSSGIVPADRLNLLRTYLSASGSKDAFSDLVDTDKKQEVLVWVDWRDEDDKIILSFENALRTGNLDVQTNETNNVIGFEIIILYKNKKHKVLYSNDNADRNTTIVTLAEVLLPDYEIRFCTESNGGDTLAFLPLSEGEWKILEKEFGQARLDYYFSKISKNSKLF